MSLPRLLRPYYMIIKNKMKLGFATFLILTAYFLCASVCGAPMVEADIKIKSQNGNSDAPLVVFDNDSFDGISYRLNGVLYTSERILFPANINGNKIMLEISIDRPVDSGDKHKYPVLILTHGRNGPFANERSVNTSRTFDGVKWRFLKEHLVVVQLARRGAGLSEGSNMDEYGMTPIDSGKEMVKDIEQTIIYMKSKSYVIENKFVIGGHSQGGWAALAAASANLNGVKCIINFSGATNYRKQPWAGNWSRKASIDFTRACKILGQTSRVPSLWIYGDSDPLHIKEDIMSMCLMYNKSGGNAKLLLLPNIQHNTMCDSAQKLWYNDLHAFLVKTNMVT